LVPCPRIVEPWTPPATAPGRRQPAPAASSGRGRRGDPTPRATSQPRPATSTTENTTAGRSRRRSSQARPRARTRSTKVHKVIAGNPVQRLKQPSRRSARSCGISITGSGGTAPAERRDTSPRSGVPGGAAQRPEWACPKPAPTGPPRTRRPCKIVVLHAEGAGPSPANIKTGQPQRAARRLSRIR
jgi:hypothetical protein